MHEEMLIFKSHRQRVFFVITATITITILLFPVLELFPIMFLENSQIAHEIRRGILSFPAPSLTQAILFHSISFATLFPMLLLTINIEFIIHREFLLLPQAS
jgi:hypothetical protein